MKIAIASKGRPNEQKTLNLISPAFSKEEITLLVEPQDYEAYQIHADKAKIKNIGHNDRGLKYVRNFIGDYFEGIVVMLDDDITSFQKRRGISEKGYWKLQRMDAGEIRRMFLFIEKFLEDNPKYAQATISFQASNWLNKKSFKENTRVWCVKFNNNDIIQDKDLYIENGGPYEDYDQTLKFLSNGYKNISFYQWAFNCVPMGTNKGGIMDYRAKMNMECVEDMVKRWGTEIVMPFFSKTHNQMEIRVNWKKAYKKANK